MITMGSQIGVAGEYELVVSPHFIVCSINNSKEILNIKVDYYRAPENSGSGKVFIGEFLETGGWRKSLIPSGTRAAGMTDFKFYSLNTKVNLVLDSIYQKGWGHAYIGEDFLLLHCEFN